MASKETNQNSLNIFTFWKAQQPAWKTTVYRTSMERLGYKAVLPYLSLYIVLMGATKAQIGYVTSLGMIVSALMAPFLGQHIDRNGPKKMYLFGIAVLLGGYIALWGAPVWQVAALGMFLHTMGSTLGGQSCSNICGNCLQSCDRAKGMLVCETFAAGALGMIGPAFAGWYLVNVMNVPEGTSPTDPNSIRPLFMFCIILTVLSMLLIIFKLDVSHLGGAKRVKRNALKDAIDMMRADKSCAKWIIMQGVNRMPTAMIIPFLQLYAAEVKGASTSELAMMTTCTALTALTCGYFVGIAADKYGRKKVLATTIGLYVAGLAILLATKNTVMLYVVGILAGFQEISMVVSGSVQNELVPHWALGRWAGANGMIGSLIAAAVAAVAGLIYDNVGPHWLFIIYIVAELVIRLPLLFTLPETLTYTPDEEKFQSLLENA
ncbi:MAG: MFS transporter [Oscillospiraceae bacterium]|nr:MFS transporter [Oscillospiraceae bacterium]